MNLTVNSPVCGLRLCSLLVGLGALAHLVRLFLGFQVLVGTHAVPMAASAVAFVVLAAFSYWLWKLSGMINPIPHQPPPPATTAMP